MNTVWYITKYFSAKTKNNRGGRDYQLLTEMAKKGIDITVITSDSNKVVDVPVLHKSVTTISDEHFKVIWLKTMKYQTAKSFKRILSWFHFEWNLFKLDTKKITKPDVIIVSSLSLLSILNGYRLKKKFNCKLFFEIRDIWPLTLTEEGGFSRHNPFVKFLAWVEKFGYKHADEIIGTMPNLGQHVSEILGYQKKVHCIPMGVSDAMLSNKTDLISSDYIDKYIPKNKFIVTYAGTIGITNALDVMFQAAEILKNKKNIHFLIVGDGPLKNEYINLYSALPNLTFAPKVQRDQVQSILSHSNLLYFSVFPSKVWDYGQSLNKITDYMLSGKPILASYNGYPSMINEAKCGEFIEANNPDMLAQKIIYYSEQSNEKLRMVGHKGRVWLEENRHYKILANHYIEILNK